jgi:hypothetical protein
MVGQISQKGRIWGTTEGGPVDIGRAAKERGMDQGVAEPATRMRTGWLGRTLCARRLGRSPQRSLRISDLNLALQGGGAHGAFTWGVLDRLLEAQRFRYRGISGTSAGAINAVVFASGWLAGGAAAARANLAELWRQVAQIARPLHQSGLGPVAMDATAQLLSPYQLNPLDLNPLREVLDRLVDFERLRRERSLTLFIAATTLRTGMARIFENHELSADAVLASACLPWLHQAVEIEGEAYWVTSATRRFCRSWSGARLATSCWSGSTPARARRCPGASARSATGSARSCSISRSSASSRCSRRAAAGAWRWTRRSGAVPAIACT